MSTPVQIPASLRHECGDQAELHISAETVQGALEELAAHYPGLYRCVCDETGAVRRHMNVFLNSTLVRGPDAMQTRLAPGDSLFIFTAVSGG